MPKVSVIVPTYNRCHVVKKCIGSILAQSMSDWEVIVVDDGSIDATQSLIEGMKDRRVRYYYKTNGGPASARNFGLSKANGKYVAFLDSDDFWPENYLEIMLLHLENNREFDAAYSAITVVHPDGRHEKSYKRPDGKSGWITVDLFQRGFVWTSASVFRSSVWQNFFFDEKLNRTYEDRDAFLRLSMHTQFVFVSDVEAYHRISADSISNEVGVVFTHLLMLERFYFKLGGDKIVPAGIARKKLSHAYRKVAEDRRLRKKRQAALVLYGRAIQYWPTDIRLYVGWLKTVFLSSREDPEPSWTMPDPLGHPVGPHRGRDTVSPGKGTIIYRGLSDRQSGL